MQLMERLAAQSFRPIPVRTTLPVKVWGRLTTPDEPVHVYIEGDGHAWRNRGLPSLDPTPHDPVALKLALADLAPNVLYLARPCQYDADPNRGCTYPVWTQQRFAQQTLLRQALVQSVEPGAELILIGFSGGANLAVQLASTLSNVRGLITLAGNLDAPVFNAYHQLSPERFGQNALLLVQLDTLPQLHYSGADDRIVPPELTLLQLTPREPYGRCRAVETVAGAQHHGPWRIDWDLFARLELSCNEKGRTEVRP